MCEIGQLNFCLSGSSSALLMYLQSLSSHITITLSLQPSEALILSFLHKPSFDWSVHCFFLSSRSFVILFIARSTMFWSFLYSMTSFLIDLYANVLFMKLATSERFLKTDKCLSHLSFPVGCCSFLNFEISIAPSDDSCVRRILKYLILFARKH